MNQQQKQPLGKRDDVEALIWTLLRLFLGELPWEKGGKATAQAVFDEARARAEGL